MPLKIRYLFEYIPFYLLTKLLSSLPFRVSVNTGKRLGRLVYRIDRKRREIGENIGVRRKHRGQVSIFHK